MALLQDGDRRTIAIGLVTTVISVILIEPIVRVAGRALLWLGNNLSAGISHSIYSNAATGLYENFSFQVWQMGVGVLCGAYLGIFLGIWRKRSLTPDRQRKWRRLSRSRGALLTYGGLTLMVLLSTLYLLAVYASSQRMIASFNQRMAALGPAISDDEEEMLRSRWARMKSRADFEAINTDMELYATRDSLMLPKRRW